MERGDGVMKYIYHSENWEIEERFKAELEKKMDFLKGKYAFLKDEDELHIHFELLKELKCAIKCELFFLNKSKIIAVHTDKDNVYSAIHKIFNKLNGQLLKFKEQITNH